MITLTPLQLIFGSAERESSKHGSVISKVVNEPVLLIALVYNPAQVVLCAWMVYAAFTEARNKGYSLVCNAFNENESGMASILYVFYLSKARGLAYCRCIIVNCHNIAVLMSFRGSMDRRRTIN